MDFTHLHVPDWRRGLCSSVSRYSVHFTLLWPAFRPFTKNPTQFNGVKSFISCIVNKLFIFGIAVWLQFIDYSLITFRAEWQPVWLNRHRKSATCRHWNTTAVSPYLHSTDDEDQNSETQYHVMLLLVYSWFSGHVGGGDAPYSAWCLTVHIWVWSETLFIILWPAMSVSGGCVDKSCKTVKKAVSRFSDDCNASFFQNCGHTW